MVNALFVLALLIAPFQDSSQLMVGRLYVNTPYATSIVYSYAGAAFPEGEPVKDGAVECFISELKSTGLFTDVRVTLKPIENSGTVDVIIEPTWNPRKDFFAISEIVFKDMTSIDKQKLRINLKRKGIVAGASPSQIPLAAIRTAVEETVHEMYQADPERENDVSEEMLTLSYRIEFTSPERVKLIISSGSTQSCRQ